MELTDRKSGLDGLRMTTKLNLSFGAVLLLMLLLGGLAASQLRSANRVTEAINDQWLPTVRWTSDLRAKMNAFRTQEFEHILAADADERKPRDRCRAGAGSRQPSPRSVGRRWDGQPSSGAAPPPDSPELDAAASCPPGVRSGAGAAGACAAVPPPPVISTQAMRDVGNQSMKITVRTRA